MKEKKSKKQEIEKEFKGYNQNQQANGHFNEPGVSEKYQENSNAHE